VTAIGEEITRLTRYEERHRRLSARLGIVVAGSAGAVAAFFQTGDA